MCQLNLYMITKNVSNGEVISIFEKYNLFISVEDYYKLDDIVETYTLYSDSYHCDCNSIISRLQEESVSSFDAYIVKKKAEDIDKLNRMKTLKASKNYKTKVKEFENQKDKLWEVIERLNQEILDYENEETEKIFALDLQDENKYKMLDEILYPKLRKMRKELGNKIEYQNALKNYEDYLFQNRDLSESIYYNIADFESKIAKYDFSDFLDEFNNLKNAYYEILKLADEICIYSFWQDENALSIEGQRQVEIQDLSIDDLVFLPYRNLLKIKSAKRTIRQID